MPLLKPGTDTPVSTVGHFAKDNFGITAGVPNKANPGNGYPPQSSISIRDQGGTPGSIGSPYVLRKEAHGGHTDILLSDGDWLAFRVGEILHAVDEEAMDGWGAPRGLLGRSALILEWRAKSWDRQGG